MPNKLKDGTLRVSYVEDSSIHRAISIMARVRGVTISALMREATEQYLKQQDPTGAMLKVAKELVARQPESEEEKLKEAKNPLPIAQIGALLKTLGFSETVLQGLNASPVKPEPTDSN